MLQEHHDNERSELHQKLQYSDEQVAHSKAERRDEEMECLRAALRKKDDEIVEQKRSAENWEKIANDKEEMLEQKAKEKKADDKKITALTDR